MKKRTKTIKLVSPSGKDSKTIRLNFSARIAVVDGCPCSLEGAVTVLHYFRTFGWTTGAFALPRLDGMSPTFSRILSERRISEGRDAASKRLDEQRGAQISRTMASRLGDDARLRLLCLGELPTRPGYPRTTIADDERDVVIAVSSC